MKATPKDLVPTGIEGLDDVLLGGVQRHNNILVEGAPGAGKTTLGLGFIHAGAMHFGEPGIIISFELDAEKLLRDAAGFNWDLEYLIEAGKVKIIQTSPSVLLQEFRSTEGVLVEELRAMGAKRLVIDGLTPLKLYAEQHHTPFREDMHTLVEGLSRLGVTTLVTAERSDTPQPSAEHERFVFDTIITLQRQEHRRRGTRKLRVLKSRGQDFISGSHAMRIEAGKGVLVYRRAQSRPRVDESQPTSTRRVCGTMPQARLNATRSSLGLCITLRMRSSETAREVTPAVRVRMTSWAAAPLKVTPTVTASSTRTTIRRPRP